MSAETQVNIFHLKNKLAKDLVAYKFLDKNQF